MPGPKKCENVIWPQNGFPELRFQSSDQFSNPHDETDLFRGVPAVFEKRVVFFVLDFFGESRLSLRSGDIIKPCINKPMYFRCLARSRETGVNGHVY